MIFWLFSFAFALTTSLVFLDGTPVSGFWALGFVSIFCTLSAVTCALIFSSRAKKMANLLSGDTLLARWTMDEQMLQDYVTLQKTESDAKNSAIMYLLTVLFTVISIPFLFMLEGDERGDFLLIMAFVLLLVFTASRFFPWYYRARNMRGDRQILIGAKYAYLNGYLHNWDFPLSGLSSIKIITSPFYGLHLIYYYTDRTFKQTHQLKIPAPPEMDLKSLIEKIRVAK